MGLACGNISHMTELTDVSGAFGYGDSILAGDLMRPRVGSPPITWPMSQPVPMTSAGVMTADEAARL